MLDPMLIEAQKLIDDANAKRLVVEKEYRLYYNYDGTITGLWESNHPDGNYIVLANPDEFHKSNSQNLRVVNGKLVLVETLKIKPRLIKSTTGQPVVKNHPAIALNADEDYTDIEYYDRNR